MPGAEGNKMKDPGTDFPPTQLLNEIEVAELLSVSRKTLQAWRWRRTGPSFLKLGGAIRYRLEDIQAYMESCLQSTADDN